MSTRPPANPSSASISAGSGSRSTAGSWAPRCRGLIHGPSRCSPARVPSSTRGARAATWSRSAPGVAETRLATTVVDPWSRWVAAARRAWAGSPESYAAPPPPCPCWSTNPGTTVRPVASTRSSPALGTGRPGPTAAIRAPATRTHPGASTAAAVTTRAAARTSRDPRRLRSRPRHVSPATEPGRPRRPARRRCRARPAAISAIGRTSAPTSVLGEGRRASGRAGAARPRTPAADDEHGRGRARGQVGDAPAQPRPTSSKAARATGSPRRAASVMC